MNDMKETKKKTKELLEQYSLSKDKDTMGKIIELNQGILHNIVKKYQWSKIEYEDLYQIACVGIIKAIQHFDLSKNIEFSTYAVSMIVGEIKREIRDKSSIIHISRKLKQKLIKCIKHIQIYQIN
jgi:RNA polymerase sigma-B factor